MLPIHMQTHADILMIFTVWASWLSCGQREKQATAFNDGMGRGGMEGHRFLMPQSYVSATRICNGLGNLEMDCPLWPGVDFPNLSSSLHSPWSFWVARRSHHQAWWPSSRCQDVVNGMKAAISDLGSPVHWRGFFLRPEAQYINLSVVLND